MRKTILLTAVMSLLAVSSVRAQETPAPEGFFDTIGVTVDATYVSKYMWNGFDLYDDKGAFQPSVDLVFGDSGFDFMVWASIPGSDGFEDAKEYDYILTYSNNLFEGTGNQIDYAFSWLYYDYIDTDSNADMQELILDFSMPNIIGCGVVPHYAFQYIWGTNSHSAAADAGGFAHFFGFSYDFTTEGFLPENPEQTFTFTWDIVYNDGYCLADDTDIHDWSHMVFGLSTPIKMGPGTLTPAVNFQKSFDDAVNTEDELWAGVSYTIEF